MKYTVQFFVPPREVEILHTNPPKKEFIEMGVLSI